MQKLTRLLWVTTAAMLLSAAIASASPVEVSISVFHDQLAPHGRWATASSYGSVWIPGGVAAGWQPYVDGEWVYSDYGWTWEADDPWGDVPYHYGTWAWVDPYGWAWIPGTVWAPAWVTWAYTDDYIGWAPVPPSFAVSARGYFGPAVVVSAARYVFVPAPKFIGVRVASVRLPAAQSAVIVSRATRTTRFEVQGGIVRAAGPPVKNVERAIGRPLERVSVDRLHVRPTSLSAGGFSNVKSVRVVAPEKERAHLAASGKDRGPSAAPEKERARTEEKAASQAPKRTEATHGKPSRRVESEPARTEPKDRHPVKVEKAEKPSPKANVSAQPSHVKTSKEKVEARPEKAEPPPEAPARPEAQARPRSEVQPRSQTQAQPRPAPQAKEKPQPPKNEDPKPPKDDGKGN